MIVCEICVLFFKMAPELITWDANCEDVLCDSVLGHYICGNLRRFRANVPVWEEIIDNLNARMENAFTVRRVLRRWKRIHTYYRRAMGVRTMSLRYEDSPVSSPNRLANGSPQ